MVSKLILLFSFAFAGALSGCSKWPPYEQDLTAQFFEYRKEIELLVYELQKSKYTDVNTSIGGDIFANYTEGKKWMEGPVSQETPEDQIKWRRLFETTGLDNVSETFEGDFVLGLDIFYLGSRKRSAFISYVNSSTIQTKFRQCRSDFAKSDCGNCIVHLSDDWWIKYGWEPASFFDEWFERSEISNWTEEEFDKKIGAAHKACLLEGGTYIDGESEY